MKKRISRFLRILCILMICVGFGLFSMEMIKFMFAQNFYMGLGTASIMFSWVPAVLSILLEPTKKDKTPTK